MNTARPHPKGSRRKAENDRFHGSEPWRTFRFRRSPSRDVLHDASDSSFLRNYTPRSSGHRHIAARLPTASSWTRWSLRRFPPDPTAAPHPADVRSDMRLFPGPHGYHKSHFRCSIEPPKDGSGRGRSSFRYPADATLQNSGRNQRWSSASPTCQSPPRSPESPSHRPGPASPGLTCYGQNERHLRPSASSAPAAVWRPLCEKRLPGHPDPNEGRLPASSGVPGSERTPAADQTAVRGSRIEAFPPAESVRFPKAGP